MAVVRRRRRIPPRDGVMSHDEASEQDPKSFVMSPNENDVHNINLRSE
jgi:hypothetical protein